MSFQSLAFLWALPVIAVPVIIHLFHRRRRDLIRWGAMDFLLEATSRRRRFSRWDDLLLMLLRTLAVLALVLALARPLVRADWFGHGAGRDVILVLDDSLSMNRRLGDASNFDRLRERARALLGQLGDRDRVRVMLAANGPRWMTASDSPADAQTKRQLGQLIAQLKTTRGTAGFLECVRAAVDAGVPEKALARYIVVIGDGQAHGWSHDATSAWQSVRQAVASSDVPTAINIVDVLAAERGEEGAAFLNLSVNEIDAVRLLTPVGQPITLTAEVRNTGTAATSETVVEWESGGMSLGVASIPPLEPQERMSIPIQHTLTRPGVYKIQCETPYEDQLREDNRASIVLDAVDNVPILIVDPNAQPSTTAGSARYLLAALGWKEPFDAPPAFHSVFEPTVVTAEELEGMDLARFVCVVMLGSQRLTEAAVERLEHFVERGGGLWVGLGEQTDPDTFNRLFYKDGDGLAPLGIDVPTGEIGQEDKYVSIHPPAGDHPATVLLGDTERLDVDNARIFRRVPFRPQAADAPVPVLLEGGSGEMLAVEGFRNRGRVIVQGFPFDLVWSNLPLCQAYVALVHEWLWYLAQPSVSSRNLQPGQSIVWQHERISEDAEATLRIPTGEPVPLLPVFDDGRLTFRYRATQLPGEYTLEWAPDARSAAGQVQDGVSDVQTSIPFHVQRDPDESDLTPLSGAQKELLSQVGALRFSAQPLQRPEAWKPASHREPIWSLLLAGLLLLMAAEMVLAGWTTKRRYDGTARAEAVSR